MGIIVPYLRDDLTSAIMHGAESVLRPNGYSLIFGPSEGRLEVEREQSHSFQRDKISGPFLTVAQPKFEIGSQTTQLLLDKISGREPATHAVVLPTALSLRSSTSRI